MAEIRRLADLPDQQLEQALADLGGLIEFPRTPDFAGAIRSRLEDHERERVLDADKARFLTPRRALMVAAAVVILFLAAALAGLPDFRHAVADRLGVRGVKIVFEDETPTPESSPVGTSLLLGQRMTLEEAQAAVPFTLRVPDLPGVGEPDEVYVRTLSDGQKMVSFIYYPSDSLPETAETGAGALLIQFEADESAAILSKAVGEGGNVLPVQIDYGEGYFVTGPSRLILYEDPSYPYCCFSTQQRPSGNVLIWEAGDLTFRLESSLDAPHSVAIAKSLKDLE